MLIEKDECCYCGYESDIPWFDACPKCGQGGPIPPISNNILASICLTVAAFALGRAYSRRRKSKLRKEKYHAADQQQ